VPSSVAAIASLQLAQSTEDRVAMTGQNDVAGLAGHSRTAEMPCSSPERRRIVTLDDSSGNPQLGHVELAQ